MKPSLARMVRRLVLLTGMAALTACSHAPMQQTTAPTQQAPALPSFQAEGKISWNFDGKGESARFSWIQRNDQQEMDLLTPLGTVAAHIRARPGHAELETREGQWATATSLEALSLRVFEVQLPLTGMEYWAQGLPIPGVPYTEETLPQGRRLIQRGLTIDYPLWVDVNGRQLPQLIEIRRQSLTLKLLIRQWTTQLDPAP